MTGITSGVDIFIARFSLTPLSKRGGDGWFDSEHSLLRCCYCRTMLIWQRQIMVNGHLPEQQLDGLLGHAISEGKRKFALIAQDTVFGQRLLSGKSRWQSVKARSASVLSDEDLMMRIT